MSILKLMGRTHSTYIHSKIQPISNVGQIQPTNYEDSGIDKLCRNQGLKIKVVFTAYRNAPSPSFELLNDHLI